MAAAIPGLLPCFTLIGPIQLYVLAAAFDIQKAGIILHSWHYSCTLCRQKFLAKQAMPAVQESPCPIVFKNLKHLMQAADSILFSKHLKSIRADWQDHFNLGLEMQALTESVCLRP